MLFKILQIFKIQRKLEKMQGEISNSAKKKKQNIWENKNLENLWDQIILKIEDMNPDSLNKILLGLSFSKSKSRIFHKIFEKVINWVILIYKNKVLFNFSLMKKTMLLFLIVNKP